MLKWFSIEGIMTEVKRIRWPKKEDLVSKSLRVLFFCALFAAFFMLCEVGVAGILKLIGIGA
jgi:preprotein translocase SecE subunit